MYLRKRSINEIKQIEKIKVDSAFEKRIEEEKPKCGKELENLILIKSFLNVKNLLILELIIEVIMKFILKPSNIRRLISKEDLTMNRKERKFYSITRFQNQYILLLSNSLNYG
jgi:hypothetical protein